MNVFDHLAKVSAALAVVLAVAGLIVAPMRVVSAVPAGPCIFGDGDCSVTGQAPNCKAAGSCDSNAPKTCHCKAAWKDGQPDSCKELCYDTDLIVD
jgi:hypothetical protein